MFRRTAVIATIAALTLTLGACSGGSTTPASSTSASAAANTDATLRVGLVLEPTNLDIRHTSGAALEQILVDNVYQGLVTRTQDNEIVDALASKHEISADGLTYTFTLQDGITFSGGQPLTSADVVAAYTQVKDDETIVGHGDFADVATITAPDDKTVVITLTQPNQNFLFSLTTPAGLVFAKDDTTDLKTATNGTGPFTLEDWKQGDSITFARNDSYWGEKASVKEVVFSYIPDFSSGVNAALDDSVDVLTAVDPNLASRFEGTDFTITRGKTTDKAVLAFNNAAAPLDDPKVREALRLAIDHKALVEAVGAGQPLYGPIPELDPGYEDLSSVVSYDPEKAKTLLAEAGKSNLSLTLTIPSFYGTTVPTYLVSAFNKIGVKLTVNSVEFATWLTDVYTNHDYQLSFVLHVEPRDFGSTWANPDYYFGYTNAKVSELYEQSLRTVDADESAKLLAEAAKIVSQDNAADWLYVGETLTAVSPLVHGFPTDSINSRIDLSQITVSE